MRLEAAPATDEIFQLAEGPVWDAARGQLLWVDIVGGNVYEGELLDRSVRVVGQHRFDGMVGAVAVAADGTMLVAAQEHLIVLHRDGTRDDLVRIVPKGSGRRCNDGSTDPSGRFLVGTLPLVGVSEHEELVRLEHDGSLSRIDDDLTLSNGLAWSADGRTMYSVDTLRRTVFERDYDPESGDVGERRPHIELTSGHPDGIALDADEHLWVAIWGEGEIRRYSPDGTECQRISVPAPHTSSVAFAGDDLRTIVVTTATEGLSDAQRRSFPDSGRLFTIPSDVPGLRVPEWSLPVRPRTELAPFDSSGVEHVSHANRPSPRREADCTDR